MSTSTELHRSSSETSLKRPSLLDSSSRSLSANGLKGRLSKLAVTPLHVPNPVAALQSNVSFVPSKIPRARRIQTLVVALWSTAMAIMTSLWLLLWFWRYFADYYPASLLKEADLPPDRPYIFGYHPHGIIGMGALVTFATEATGFSEAFPGLKPHLLTLSTNFQVPLYRDILLSLGICSVSKESCSNILKAGPGSSIAIVVGGAAESLSAHPGTADLTLRKRLGFIKVAIQHGADLVPVFSFGENDIYQQMANEKGTTTYALQRKFQSMFGFTLPLFHGRGLLNYNVGLLPYRRQIVAVIGRPIHVIKCDKPSLEDVIEVQKLYIDELTRIWNTYKDTFAKARLRELMIVD